MNTYTVDIVFTSLYQSSIEADSEEEAIEKAKDEIHEECDVGEFTSWQASKES